MIRDFIAHEVQKIQPLIPEGIVTQIIDESHSPSATYYYLDVMGGADTNEIRGEWQKRNEIRPIMDAVGKYYQESFASPNIDLTILPLYSFVLQFTFTLLEPYISRDEQNFYIMDNPVRKDKVFGLPYVASTSWKGSLRNALWHRDHGPKDETIIRLFGNDKNTEEQQFLKAGRLYFFPTFFTRKSLEVINPQDRETRTGKQPILFESVPIDTPGIFTLLYVPFNLIGKNEKETRQEIAEDLVVVSEGIQAMFRIYGFGAKTSSGFGLVKEAVSGGMLKLRAIGLAKEKAAEVTSKVSTTALPRYLETADKLKPEYLTENGVFRERSEAEIKRMSKNDRQLYDKARSWWEREGKKRAEGTTLSDSAEPPSTKEEAILWPEWKFSSFEQLTERITEVKNSLVNGGAV
jgi:CRISPR-associated protein Cmr2